MKDIKISELFYSIQGEGRYMGVPSVFLRTFGCNFKCAGFGMPKGQLSEERFTVDADTIKQYKDLPLVSTGCDSYASWDPRFKHLSSYMSIDEIVKKIMEILPHNRWVDEHLVITGGEPLLGWQQCYPELLRHPSMVTLKELTIETNGTQKLYPEFIYFIENWKRHREKNALTFSVSPKLSISGEDQEEAIRPEIIHQYKNVGFVYLKFVCDSLESIHEAEKAVEKYRRYGFAGPVYLMPVGGVESVYSLNNKNVALEAMKRGWRYSDRLQVPLFKNEWGT